GLGGGVELGIHVRHGLDDPCRHGHRALLAVQELAEQPGTQLMPEFVALLLVQDLPLPRAVDRHELVRGLHDVGRVHRQIPFDPLGGVPLLVLAALVQVEQSLPAVVVLPAEAGGAGGGNVPGAGLDGDCVCVIGAHAGSLGGRLAHILLVGIKALYTSLAPPWRSYLRQYAARGHRQTDGSCPAWLAGSSWNVEWPTSKWPCRQAWRASSMAALRPLASTPGSTTTCAESTGRPEVMVQACRSCTPTTPSSAVRWVRTSVRSMPRGLASSSTSTASRSSRQVRGRMSRATASEAIGSIRVNPVAAITIPVPITAMAPKVSEATSRKAPRTFMLSACPCRSSRRDTPLPASATTP